MSLWIPFQKIKEINIIVSTFFYRQGSYRYKRGSSAVLKTDIKKVAFEVTSTEVSTAMDTQ